MRKIAKKLIAVAAFAAISSVSVNADEFRPESFTAPFSVVTTIDLSEAQSALQNMLNGVRQASRCDANWNVWDAHVLPNGSSIKVDFHARYFLNKCVIVRTPEWHGMWRVVWHDRVVGETILVSQAGHIAVDVTPVIGDGVVSVETNVVTADMSGLLGRLKINGQVKSFLNDKIQRALRDKLKLAIPAEMMKAGVHFSEVRFVDLGGSKLGLTLKAEGKLKTGS